MKRSVMLNGQRIEYELIRKKVKNINLRVRPDGSVTVSAANSVPVLIVEAFLQTQANRILHALQRFSEIKIPKPFQLMDGATFFLLGQSVPLQMIRAAEPAVNFLGDTLLLMLLQPDDAAQAEHTFQQWYTEMCKTIFCETCSRLLPLLQRYQVAMPAITIRTMKTRWGSCRPQKQSVTLNRRLLQYPLAAIEFVVLHELVHFVHPDHSHRFYALLTELMPDWQERKKLLLLQMPW